MSDVLDQSNTGLLSLPLEYSANITNAVVFWSATEYHVNVCVGMVANLPPTLAACLTSQVHTLQGRFNALLALLKTRRAPENLIKEVTKFADTIRSAQEARNRIIHDMWLGSESDPPEVSQFTITANKKLEYGIRVIPIQDLRADVKNIYSCMTKMTNLRALIEDTLPQLLDIDDPSLSPIEETRTMFYPPEK